MKVICPNCKVQYEVADSEEGRKAECACGCNFVMTPVPTIKPDYVFHCSAWNYFWYFFLSILFLVPLFFICLPVIIFRLIQIRTTVYTITSDRLVAETGLLNKRKTSVFLSDIRNVDVNQRLWQRIVKIGTIRISTAGNAGYEITMVGVPEPDKIVQLLNAGH